VISKDGTTLYVSDGSCLEAINAADGSKKWEVEAVVIYAPALSPDGRTIYSGTWDGFLLAVDTSGSIRWKSQPFGGYTSSPCVDSDGNIYVNAGGYCWAFDPDGRVRWKYPILGHFEPSSPSIGWNGSIYVVGIDILYALDYSGKFKWAYELKSVGGTETKISENTPVLDIDETIYLGTLTRRVLPDTVNFIVVDANGGLKYALSLRSPEKPGVPQNYLYPDIDSTPAIGPGVLYVGSDRPQGVHLYRIN
jgi:outer membrane protein assembly factor BamB